MTPDQYRRQGAEAMREAVVSLLQDLIKARQADISREGMKLAMQGRPSVKYALRRKDIDARMSCRDSIHAINVDEVLSGLSPPAPIAEAQLVEAMKHLHDIINCGNCSGSRQSARLALRALAGDGK